MDFRNKIICGDNLKVLSMMDNMSVDMVVCSPPYDLARDYNGFVWDSYKLGTELFRVLKDDGVCIINIGDMASNHVRSGTSFKLVTEWITKLNWYLFETLLFVRAGRPGAWNTHRFRTDHEYMFIFSKRKALPSNFSKEHLELKVKPYIIGGTQRKTDGSLYQREKKLCDTKSKGTLWRYTTSTQEPVLLEADKNLKFKHPATYPNLLAIDLIRTFTKPGDLILDPFGGSCTTAIGALITDRDFCCTDLSREYCEIGVQRVQLYKDNLLQAKSMLDKVKRERDEFE